jgi:hypothetical protein
MQSTLSVDTKDSSESYVESQIPTSCGPLFLSLNLNISPRVFYSNFPEVDDDIRFKIEELSDSSCKLEKMVNEQISKINANEENNLPKEIAKEKPFSQTKKRKLLAEGKFLDLAKKRTQIFKLIFKKITKIF